MKLKLLFLSVGIQLSRNVWHLVGSVWSSLGTSQNRERVKIGEQVKTGGRDIRAPVKVRKRVKI